MALNLADAATKACIIKSSQNAHLSSDVGTGANDSESEFADAGSIPLPLDRKVQ